MKLVYSSLLIADYLLAYQKRPYTAYQVQKLTYICHGWTLAHLKTPLIKDIVEAWEHGPVIPTLYYTFLYSVPNPITHLSYCNTPLDSKNDLDKWKEFVKTEISDESDVATIIHNVLDAYGELNSNQLYSITHRKNSPWKSHYDKDKPHAEIPNPTTEEYYTAIKDGRIK